MIHAYNEMYLSGVMKNLAALTDMAINAEGLGADEFGKLFASSGVAKKIEHAIPDMLAGKSATEMLALILNKSVNYVNVPMDRTPEYWAGWIMARAQWELDKTFAEILSVMPLSSLIKLYHPYHEADDSKTIDLIRSKFPPKESTLKQIRKSRRLTQEQLSILSGVNLRSIRAYEQGDNDLAKAQGETLQMLAHTLDCTIEEFLQYRIY